MTRAQSPIQTEWNLFDLTREGRPANWLGMAAEDIPRG